MLLTLVFTRHRRVRRASPTATLDIDKLERFIELFGDVEVGL
jgi:hypothetical protein